MGAERIAAPSNTLVIHPRHERSHARAAVRHHRRCSFEIVREIINLQMGTGGSTWGFSEEDARRVSYRPDHCHPPRIDLSTE